MNATVAMKFTVLIFCMSAVLKCGEGNVLRIDKSLSGILLSTDHDEEWNTVEINNKNTVKAFNSHLDLDKSSNLRLKEAKTYDFGSLYNFHQRTDVHHFARHGLCRHDAGKIRLYKALKSKLCHSGGFFVAQLVDGLCKDKGVDLDIWVSELFDFDGELVHVGVKCYLITGWTWQKPCALTFAEQQKPLPEQSLTVRTTTTNMTILMLYNACSTG